MEMCRVDCSIIPDGDSIVIENRFGEPSDFELSTNIYLRESQNIRMTVMLVDYVADMIQDNSLARSKVEAYIDFGNDVHSQKSDIVCNKDCIHGIFTGNIDIRNSNLRSDIYKLVVIIHAYTQDKFQVNLVSIGDLVLASEIFENSKGKSFRSFTYYIFMDLADLSRTQYEVSLRIRVRVNLLQMYSLEKLVLEKVQSRVGRLVCLDCLKLEMLMLEQLHWERGCQVQYHQMDIVPLLKPNFNQFWISSRFLHCLT